MDTETIMNDDGDDEFNRVIRARLPHPGDTPLSRAVHTLAAFDGVPDSAIIRPATYGVYGPNVTTGMTWGDLRALVHGTLGLMALALGEALEEAPESHADGLTVPAGTPEQGS